MLVRRPGRQPDPDRPYAPAEAGLGAALATAAPPALPCTGLAALAVAALAAAAGFAAAGGAFFADTLGTAAAAGLLAAAFALMPPPVVEGPLLAMPFPGG